jgi:tRNA threonylcarbamoyladenosine biosynthesis protein TsaB
LNILAFDTCFAACSVAVATDAGTRDERIFTCYEPMQTGHAERLVAMVGEVMAQAGVNFRDIDRIGVTNGPGSFVGTRVGVSAARAFALVTNVPAIAVSSLEVMARGAARLQGNPSRDLCVAVDMRRDEVYIQLFDGTATHAKSAPLLLDIDRAAVIAEGRPVTFVGTGARAIAERIGAGIVGAGLPDLLPDARDIVGMVTKQSYADTAIDPLYLRPPDAKPSTAGPLQRQ